VNIDPGRSQRAQLSDADLELVRAQNALDLELYAWAADRFNETLGSWPGFDEALATFRRENERYQPWGKLAQAPRRAVERLTGR
jgi:hypothetical protein